MGWSEYFRNCWSSGIFTISRVYRKWSGKKKKNPVSGSSVGENALLMPEVRGEWPDWFKLIEKQQYGTTKICRRASLKAQHVEP